MNKQQGHKNKEKKKNRRIIVYLILLGAVCTVSFLLFFSSYTHSLWLSGDLFENKDSGDYAMARLYNPNSGEHFFTSGWKERENLVKNGWRYEGTAWYAPRAGTPVYRLYNKNSGDHHYTLSSKERDYLVKSGWSYEGIGWYSGGTVPVYRQYNPNAKTGSHNFTTSLKENNALVKNGWRAEGIAWYGESHE